MKNKQIWGRIGQIVLVLLGISFVTFALVMLSPGDPVRQMIAGNEDIVVSQVEIDALRHELGLDKPFVFQYLDWLGRAVQGNFGFSYMVKKPVVEELMQSLPATLILALASTFFMLIFSLPLGIYSAVKRNSIFDYAVRGLTFFGVSIPNFWMGLMLLWIFGLKLGWLPIVGGRVSLETLILPATTLGIVMAAKYTRQVRTTVLEELNQDYVVGARARGMSESYSLAGSIAECDAAFDYTAGPVLRQSAGRRGSSRDRFFLAGAWLFSCSVYHLSRLSACTGDCFVDSPYVYGHQFSC